MKVGDLVRCPESQRYSERLGFFADVPGYIGAVSHVCGYKITVLGGDVVSWDGIKGKRMWDRNDLTLMVKR